MRLVFIVVLASAFGCGPKIAENLYGKQWSQEENIDHIKYSDHDGSNFLNAVKIAEAKDDLEWTNAVFHWVEKRHGTKHIKWRIKGMEEEKNQEEVRTQCHFYMIDGGREFSYYFYPFTSSVSNPTK